MDSFLVYEIAITGLSVAICILAAAMLVKKGGDR